MNSEGRVISNVQGYQMVQIAQNLGLYLTSSEEWGKSRRYFQENADIKFHGKAGSEIENSYISRHIEQTGSLLSFKEKGEFQGDTYDLLKKAGFDGDIALIDYPYVQKDGENLIFIKSPRMRIRDVTEINGKPFPKKEGRVQEYDWDTGLITEVNHKINSNFDCAYYCIVPKGTRMVLRGGWFAPAPMGGRFRVDVEWEPSNSHGDISARLSSRNKPSEILRLSP